MKALSLWQPWVSLMAAGLKTIETRHWPTGYRGPLAIHAAKRPLGADEKDLIEEWAEDGLVGWDWLDGRFPLGAIMAVVDLIDCCRMEDLEKCWYASWFNRKEQPFGNFAPGRWAWVTRSLRAINPPIPYRGQ